MSPLRTTGGRQCAGVVRPARTRQNGHCAGSVEGGADGFSADPNQTVAACLDAWLTPKALVLKPTTMARYREYVRNDLVPAFGTLKLDQLAHRHISAFVTSRLTAGRGRTTPPPVSSARDDAVRRHRLPHDPASPPGRTKGRPLIVERTTSDLRFRMVGTTGFEPATP
ncbi:hypothetical protein ACIQOF_15420 [Streptomyces sp. NPDC091265]|uniref:hypothetical protein n=1 Tax=unclassified Streptomyces TaxID=2593676 RepID=UPI00344C751C